MANHYKCSNGESVTEAQIKTRLSRAYKEKYAGSPRPRCSGCGGRAIETSHVLAKAYVKTIHKTELIWESENMFPSCRKCHLKWEAIYNPEWCYLSNVAQLLYICEKYDKESYIKRLHIYETEISRKDR